MPKDLSFLHSLQELNLAANNLQQNDSDNLSAMFKSISLIPLLRKLNLSRNKLTEFFSDMLPENNASLVFESQVFIYLEELYFAFNNVPNEAKLFYPVVQIPSLKYLVITGNPFAMRQDIGVSIMGTPTIGTNEQS